MMQSKECVATPLDVPSALPSSDQGDGLTAGPVDAQATSMDEQATLPPTDNEAPQFLFSCIVQLGVFFGQTMLL